MNPYFFLALPFKYSISYVLFGISAVTYAYFWIWGIIHAASTPKATVTQRLFWSGSMLVNPSATIWYWYIWKRWAFWLLFTPILGAFFSLPFVVKSMLTSAQATLITNNLFALGTQQLVIVFAALMIFPLLLRLAALLHLGRNTELSAMDRNDWVVALAMPVFGFGAGVAYTARYLRIWALVSLLWCIAIIITGQFIIINVANELATAGNQKRVEFRALNQLP